MNGFLRLAELNFRNSGNRTRLNSVPMGHWPTRFAIIASLALAVAFALHAQKPAPKAPHHDAQQPGSGAQVHTGTGTGLDTDTRLLNMLADHEFTRLEGELDDLPPWQAQFYRGVLANRNNDLAKSIALLEPIVDQVSAGANPRRERVLRKSLAEDYLRIGNWAKAAEAYATLEARLGGSVWRSRYP